MIRLTLTSKHNYQISICAAFLPSTESEWTRATTPEQDDLEEYGEFCLPVSDDSHWSSSEPQIPLPMESAHTRSNEKSHRMRPVHKGTENKQQSATGQTQTDSQSTQPPTEPSPTYEGSTEFYPDLSIYEDEEIVHASPDEPYYFEPQPGEIILINSTKDGLFCIVIVDLTDLDYCQDVYNSGNV